MVFFTTLHSLHLYVRFLVSTFFFNAYVFVLSLPLVVALLSFPALFGLSSIVSSRSASAVDVLLLSNWSVPVCLSFWSFCISSAIALSTLTGSNLIGSGATSTVTFGPPMGISTAFSSSLSSVSSLTSPKLSRVSAASISSSVLTAPVACDTSGSSWASTKSGSWSSVVAGTPVNSLFDWSDLPWLVPGTAGSVCTAGNDGTAGNVALGFSLSVVFASGDIVCLLAACLVAEGPLPGLYVGFFLRLGLDNSSCSRLSFRVR